MPHPLKNTKRVKSSCPLVRKLIVTTACSELSPMAKSMNFRRCLNIVYNRCIWNRAHELYKLLFNARSKWMFLFAKDTYHLSVHKLWAACLKVMQNFAKYLINVVATAWYANMLHIFIARVCRVCVSKVGPQSWILGRERSIGCSLAFKPSMYMLFHRSSIGGSSSDLTSFTKPSTCTT